MSSPASPQHNKTEHKALQAQTCLPSLACPASTRQGESPTDLLGTETHLFRTWWAAVLVYRIAPPSFRNPHRFVLCISPLSLCIPWNTFLLRFHFFVHCALQKDTEPKGSNMNSRQTTSTETPSTALGVDARTDYRLELNSAWEQSIACILSAITLPELFPFYLVLCPPSFRVSRTQQTGRWARWPKKSFFIFCLWT